MSDLGELFAATLHAATSKTAEARLREMDTQPNFMLGVLNVVASSTMPSPIRRAAAVYLKNVVRLRWSSGAIGDDEKRDFRAKIVQAIPQAVHTRDILLIVVHIMLAADFPLKAWPELLPQIKELVHMSDVTFVHAGLSLLLQVARWYRYQRLELLQVEFNAIFTDLWPSALRIGEACSQQFEQNAEAAAILYDILKIVKFATVRLVPDLLQNADVCGRTTQIHIRAAAPTASEPSDSHVIKCQKWATFNILQLHERFLRNPKRTLALEMQERYAAFRKMYLEHFSPQIVGAYLEFLAANRWYGGLALHHIVAYLRLATLSSTLWPLIQPHIEGLISGVLFPLLCSTEEDADLYEDEPGEFIQNNTETFEEAPTASNAASSFLVLLTKKRPETFNSILQFMTAQTESAATSGTAAEQAGALRMFGALAPVLMKLLPQDVPRFVVMFAVPAFKADNGIVRFRAAQVVLATAELLGDRSILPQIYTEVYRAFTTGDLPVRFISALTLRVLSNAHDDVRATIGQSITEVVRGLLQLTKQYDSEALLAVLDELVAQFPDQITPFAVELSEQLRDQFLQLASDLQEAEDDPSLLLANEEKVAAGTGILGSLMSLQTSLEEQEPLQIQLEAVVSAIFVAVYQFGLTDFFTETFELHENTLFSLKRVSDVEWQLFPLLVTAIQHTELDFLDEALPLLHNFVLFGADSMNSSNLSSLIRLVVSATKPDTLGTIDTAKLALSLATRIMLAPQLQSAIVPVIEVALQRLLDVPPMVPPRYHINLLTVFLAAFITGPEIAVSHLAQVGALERVMSEWFTRISEFKRLSDFKISEVATLSLLSVAPAAINPWIPQLLEALAAVLEALPTAISRHAELQRLDADQDWDDFEYETWSDVSDASDDETATQGDSTGVAATLPRQQQQQAVEAEQASDPLIGQHSTDLELHWEEFANDEYYGQEPLESVNPFQILKSTFANLSANNSDYYNKLLGHMSSRTQQVIQDSLHS